MSKRFTETSKWSDPWFRGLSLQHKALWLWMLDNCDCAGVLPEIDWGLVSFQIGTNCTQADMSIFADRVERCGKGYWIAKFIAFQWGEIGSDSHSTLHRGVIKALERVSIPLAKAYPRVTQGLPKGYLTLKDKDTDKDTDKDITSEGGVGETLVLGVQSEQKPAIPEKSPAQLRAERLHGKRPTTPWDKSELAAWRQAEAVVSATTDDEWKALETFYAAPQEKTFARKSLAVTLNNWSGELQRAMAWQEKAGVAWQPSEPDGY